MCQLEIIFFSKVQPCAGQGANPIAFDHRKGSSNRPGRAARLAAHLNATELTCRTDEVQMQMLSFFETLCSKTSGHRIRCSNIQADWPVSLGLQRLLEKLVHTKDQLRRPETLQMTKSQHGSKREVRCRRFVSDYIIVHPTHSPSL